MVYMGSKARLVKHIAPIIQSYITPDTVGYLEPFVGGANMIQHIKHDRRFGSDINKYLIALLKYAQDLNNTLPETISEEEYNKVKNNKDSYPDWYVGFVGFCSTYSGKFYGGYGKSKVGRNYSYEMILNLKKQRSFLSSIKFKCLSYTDIFNLKNFVIYCDPPYFNTTKYSSKFFNYDFFWNWARKYSKYNTVLISEYEAPNDFIVLTEVDLKNCVALGETAKKPVERLFKWKE